MAQRCDQDENQEMITLLTQHLERLQSMYNEIEAIETEIANYETAATRVCAHDLTPTLSNARETADSMLCTTQGFLSTIKDYVGSFILYLLSLPSAALCHKPTPTHSCSHQK
jgi:hypothetical protein